MQAGIYNSFSNPAIGFLNGLRPQERLTVSQWADKYRYLAPGASPEPGLYKSSRTPYLRRIMDCLSKESSYKLVIYMKASQIGASEAGFNWLGYSMDISPAAILAVMPTAEQMKRNSKIRIDPMIKATPRLSSKISSSNKKDSTNTILQKDFAGGFLVMTGANSASGLKSVPAERIMADEVDEYPHDLEDQGDTLDLAIARTRTYQGAKIFVPSTPKVKGFSTIEKLYDSTDKNNFFVPCPHCGAEQVLIWESIKWEGDDPVHSPKTTFYQCIHCGDKILERHKRDMLACGEWKPTDLDKVDPEVIGFHNNSLVSPWFTWENCVKDFLKAGKNEAKLKVFMNTILGLPTQTAGDAPPWEDIYNKAYVEEKNKPCNHVKIITAGVDVQKDRVEVHIVGWGHGRRRWVLDYRIIHGFVEEDKVFDELAEIVNETWIRADGLEMPLRYMAVDSGSFTDRVYAFCKRFSKFQVAAIKGYDHLTSVFGKPTSVHKTDKGKDYPGVILYPVGSSYLKTALYGYLKLQKLVEDDQGPRGYVHLLKGLHDGYYKGLVAEQQVSKEVKGVPKLSWERIYARNEPLDTMNYAYAAAAIAGLDRHDDDWLDEEEKSYMKTTPQEAKKDDDTSYFKDDDDFWSKY